MKMQETITFSCQLHWGSHCFNCNGLSHFTIECQKTPRVVVFISPNDVVMPTHVVNNKDIIENDGVLLLEKNKQVLKKRVNMWNKV